jgi:hypothetical protein
VPLAAARQQPPAVQQPAGEREADRDRLPQQVRQRHRDAGHRVHHPGDEEPRVQEHPVVGRHVVLVADQPVLAGLADPREVLQLVRGEQAVGAGKRPALREQRGEHEQ